MEGKGNADWFVNGRFGLFIHWGVYALPGRHEWVKKYESIPDEVYDRYLKYFNPDLYEPRLWAKAAYEAGMRYFVVTTKHHDGFCLWDSKHTDYKATNTPAGRDLIRPMVEAFREQGMKVGFYHSIIDWHHPDFVIDDTHPLSGHPDREVMNKKRNQKKYIEYLHSQVRELLTDFGRVDLIFFDFSYPAGKKGRPDSFIGKGKDDWDSGNLIKMVRELQPGILVNDRLDLDDDWDYKTPEQYQPRECLAIGGERVTWEACQTFSGSWGYHRDEMTWKTTEILVKMLIDTVSKGGNLLLNVGPTARGEFDYRALERLNGIGEWMKRHCRSIYGCTAAPEGLSAPEDCRLTFNPETGRIYVHVFSWPFKHLHLDGFEGKVEHAQFLNDNSEVRIVGQPRRTLESDAADRQTVTLELPVRSPEAAVPVIELFMKKTGN